MAEIVDFVCDRSDGLFHPCCAGLVFGMFLPCSAIYEYFTEIIQSFKCNVELMGAPRSYFRLENSSVCNDIIDDVCNDTVNIPRSIDTVASKHQILTVIVPILIPISETMTTKVALALPLWKL